MELDTEIGWDNLLPLGLPLIDDQHRNLLRMAKKLYTMSLESSENANQFIETLHETIDYIQYHFSTEEKIMFLTQYEGYIDHKKNHGDFISKILVETALITSHKSPSPDSLVCLLKEWIISHITVHDKMLVEYIRNTHEYGKFGMILNTYMKSNLASP
jgi:hemerythrin